MRQKFALISVLIFVISALVYFVSMFITDDLFSGTVMIMIAIGLPIIGLVLAFKGKGVLKAVAIVGNILVLLIAGIIPVISTIFWNSP